MRHIIFFIHFLPHERLMQFQSEREWLLLTHLEVTLLCLIFWVSYAAFGNLPYGAILTSYSQCLTAFTKAFMYKGCLPNSP